MAPVRVFALLLALGASGVACRRGSPASVSPELLRERSPFDPQSARAPTSGVAAEDGDPPPSPRVKNVLLLTVDALRADQPWSGYRAAATPTLSAFAEQSVVYLHAYSVANTTTPSLAAILSSRYPSELARDNCPLAGFRYDDGLPRTLLASGLHTFAAHGHAIFASAFAPSDGFVDWKLVENAAGRRASDGAVTGDEIAALVSTFLSSDKAKTPFFAWAHFVDPHDRYVEHADFPPSGHGERGMYDGEVAYTDHAIGRVLSALDEAGLRETTAVIVTADHGEAFGEHERYRHGFTVHDEEIHVPLLLRIPGTLPRREEVRRSTIDLAPTIASLLGVPAPASWRGTSLLSDVGAEKPAARIVLVDTPELRTLPAQRAFLEGDLKVIVRRDRTTTVYDLTGDPEERAPLHNKAAEDASERALTELSRIPLIVPDLCQRDAATP